MYIEGGSKNLSTYFVNNSLYEMSLEMTLQIIGWWWQSNSYFQIPNTKLSQKRFKNRKKKTDQVVVEQQIQQVEEIVEFEEDVEIIPDISETDLARNEMVADADFIEEIPEPEIELEEVEEVSLLL